MLDDFEYPLVCQAVPLLSRRLGIECELTEDIFPVGLQRGELESLNKKREEALGRLRRKGVTLWDVFDESGIGQERNALALNFTNRASSLLDIASGRGYFTFAAARRTNRVVALDLMDGQERVGWWKVFHGASDRLGLAHKVSGIRSDVSFLPLARRKFDLISCVHALRNFLIPGSRRETIEEMSRVVSADGRVMIVESSLEAESPAEEVYLDYLKLRARIGWEVMPPSRADLEELMSEAGFSDLAFELKKFDRDYAPLELPSFVIRTKPQKIKEEHARIEKLRSQHGIKPPAALVALAGAPAK